MPRFIFLLALLAACGGGSGPGSSSATGLALLSDEFDDPASLPDWERVYVVEQWGFDQLESIDIGTMRAGALTMMPYACTWFEDYRGLLAFKRVPGDFVVTTQLEVTNRAATGAPAVLFSLAGIMIRVPRAVTPATWQPGGENYIFLSLGAADTPSTFQTEVKTTVNSVSTLSIAPAASGVATIRVARLGATVITLIRPDGGSWQVHRRYTRADFPNELQVGLTTYTDWTTVSALTPVQHNNTQITGGNPDLIAHFDYVRFEEPQVPAALAGADFSDPAAVSDAQLLSFLGG